MTGVPGLETLDLEIPSTEALKNSFADSKLPGINRFLLPLLCVIFTHDPSMSDLEHSTTVLARSWQSENEIGVSAGAPCTTKLVELVREAGVSVLSESDRSIHYIRVTALNSYQIKQLQNILRRETHWVG